MAKEAATTLLDKVKQSMKEGNTGVGGIPDQIIFIPKDAVKAVRFLTDFEEAVVIEMHDKFKYMYPQPCFSYYNKKCPFHDAPGFRVRTQYAFTVFDYESKVKKLFMTTHGPNSAMDDIVEIYEKNKTLKDRDIKLIRTTLGGKTKYKAREVQGVPTPFEVKNVTQPFSKDMVFGIVKGLISKVKVDAEVEAVEEDKISDNGIDPLAETPGSEEE